MVTMPVKKAVAPKKGKKPSNQPTKPAQKDVVPKKGEKPSNQPPKHSAHGPAVWALIKGHVDNGLGARKISSKLGMKRGAVDYIVQKLKNNGGDLSRKKGSGRPRSVATPAVTASVEKIVKGNPKIPTTELAKQVGLKRSTAGVVVRRDIGQKSVSLIKSSTISKKAQEARVRICAELLGKIKKEEMRVEEIFFNDEKLFTVGGLLKGSTRNSRLRIPSGMSKKQIPPRDIVIAKKRRGNAVMCALAVSHKGLLEPHFIERGVKINHEIFLDLLKNAYAPNMALMYGGMRKFWHCRDNAPAHARGEVKKWISSDLKSFEWPSCSPDLNVLDYSIWSIIDAKVQAGNPKDVNDLKVGIIKACRETPIETVRNAIAQFPERLRLWVENEGNRFEYKMK